MKRQRTGEAKKAGGRSSSPAAPPPQPRVSPPLQAELRRARQLDAAIESHEAALSQLRAQSREETNGEARGASSSPPADDVERLEDDVARLTAANSAAVHEALRALRVSEVLAVDCGGDVLTGGLDFATHVELGRDRQVLRALQTSAVPYTMVVLGPGCDAESSVAAMTTCVRASEESGELLGVLPLDELAPAAAAFAAFSSAFHFRSFLRDASG